MSDATEIIVLSKGELADIIRRTATAVVDDLRDDIATFKTPELMTKAELADYLRCDVSKINRMMKTGLPHEPFGSAPRFRKSSIDRWLQRGNFQEIQGQAN